MERTLILVKPDGMQRALGGEILSRFERKGLQITGLKLVQIDRDMATRHYAEHVGKGFFDGLVAYITSSPVIAAVLSGPGAVGAVRTLLGATNPLEAAPGTIRSDFGVEKGRNLVHASDSPESAEREIALFFQPAEVIDWKRDLDRWILE